MTILFSALYLAVCAVHLLFCWKQISRWQDRTKVLLMPLLLAAALSTGSCPLFTALALFFGWIGDVLLLRPREKPFFLGGLTAFLVGHICYIPVLARAGHYSLPFSLPVGAALLLLGAGAYATLHRRLPPAMRIPVTAYLLVILCMAFAAVHTLRPQAIAGACAFVLSDYLLARGLFIQKGRYGDFLVMLTYLGAQLCLGLLFYC